MRISDWSSDVCSSDLSRQPAPPTIGAQQVARTRSPSNDRATAMEPRGVRNRNPGNIDRTGVPWIGEDRSPEAREREHRFCVFKTPEHGFRALVRVLLTYQRKYRLRRSEEHTSEIQSLMRISYAVFRLKKKN